MAAAGMVTTIPLPFVPSVLVWSDDAAHLVAGGISVPFTLGTAGLAVLETATGTVAWHLDGWGCADAQVAGSLVAACLGRGGTDPGVPFQSRLETHDLASGTRVWQRGDIPLTGHARVSADRAGRLLAVSTAGDYALVDAETGRDVARVALKPVLAFRPAVTPSGAQLAAAYDQGAGGLGVAVCDTSTGTVRHQTATSSTPLVAEFDETGSTVTIVEMGGFVTVVDTASGTQVSRSALAGAHMLAASAAVAMVAGRPVALSPDRRIVLVAETDCNSLYAAATGERLGTVPAANTALARAAFSPAARTAAVTVAVPTHPTLVNAMAMTVPRPQVTWQQNLPEAPAAAFSRGGRLAVAQKAAVQPAGATPVTYHGTVLIDVVTNDPLLAVAAASGTGRAVFGVDMASGDRLIVCVCADKTARLFTIDDGKLRNEWVHPGPLTDVVFLGHGRVFATACTDGRVRLFDTVTGQQPWFRQYTGPVNALAAAPDGGFACTGGSDKTARCLDTATGTQRWQAAFPQGVTRLIISSDGAFAVAACADRTVRLLRAADGSQAWQVQHDARVRDIAVSPDATLVATACQDGTVRVLASGTGQISQQVSHARGATSVAFSADGRDLVSGALDGTVLVSTVADPGAPPPGLLRSAAPVRQVKAGPGRSVAVVTEDGLIRIVDLGLQADLARIYAGAAVNDIAVEAGAGLLASGADDGTLRVDPWPQP
jgi:outer membrane protein assembly factor BamB